MTAEKAQQKGHDVMVIAPKSHTNMKPVKPEAYLFGHVITRNIGTQLAYYTGYSGCFNYCDTCALLKHLKAFKPDIIHLHNLHSEYINLRLLFNYIKKANIAVVWTLHDCWSFTGGCAHFVMEKCNKWQTHCYGCKIHRQYPGSYFDNSQRMWGLKREWFTGVNNMTIVTPSMWLMSLVYQSFLKNYPVRVINNGINLDVFKPSKSDFRKRYDLINKKIVLGVSFGWGLRKGLDVMIKLSDVLPENYKIVMVGTNENIDKQVPSNVLSIHRTDSQQELCEIYSIADVFANPTREDTFPTVNLEALACGTPVVTFATGGSPECIDETCGIVVPIDDIEAMRRAVIHVCEDVPFSRDACLDRAKKFDQHVMYDQYVDMYEEVGKRNTSRW